MQSVSSDFTTHTKAGLRKLSYKLLMSFLKNYDGSTTFFTIGTSTIGGLDIIKGDGSVVQEWDKYHYDDYSGRVLQFEYDRQAVFNPETPVILATADLVLDNSDDYFTPTNTNSPIYGKVLPQRPIRLYTGFNDETIQVFIGVTEGMPTIDQKNRTATFHCLDFLYSLYNQTLDADVIYTDSQTDVIIAALLQAHGLGATQYSLDTGTTIIPFAYFKKGSKLGEALTAITQAELGRLYMSETGVITFENRTNWLTNHTTSQWHFDDSNVYDMQVPQSSDIINVVQVKSNGRAVAFSQAIWELNSPVAVPPGGTVDIFADFSDADGDLPVTAVDTPVDQSSATSSFWESNTQTDNSGADGAGDITLSSSTLFSTAYKMTFANGGVNTLYITRLVLYGTPAKVQHQIYARTEDTASIALYDEKLVEINNDYIQDETAASSIGQIIISDSADQKDKRQLFIKGVPQLQIGDLVTYINASTYYLSRINGIYNNSGFRQNITILQRTIVKYFTIGVSSIGGSDQIAP